MDSGKSICCVLLFQHLQKLLYSSNRQTYDAVVEVIQASFPQFSQYLEVNWFPHEALFAGFARAGVLHLDNHTNNRLERYHHTIKSVVGSSQVSVGILIDRLQKLLNVRVMSMQQAEFNQRMKSRVNVSDVVAGYSAFVSHFAADRIAYEHSKSLTMTNVVTDIDNDMFCVGKYNCSCTHCQCNAFTGFHLPCRHIFLVRRTKRLPEVHGSLVDQRWHVGSIATSLSYGVPHDAAVVQSSIPIQAKTAAQRFKTLMSILTPMASAMAELPPRKFESCLQWVGQLEAKVRAGTWTQEVCTSDLPVVIYEPCFVIDRRSTASKNTGFRGRSPIYR